jgi:uncharacterized membrane protein YgcG
VHAESPAPPALADAFARSPAPPQRRRQRCIQHGSVYRDVIQQALRIESFVRVHAFKSAAERRRARSLRRGALLAKARRARRGVALTDRARGAGIAALPRGLPRRWRQRRGVAGVAGDETLRGLLRYEHVHAARTTRERTRSVGVMHFDVWATCSGGCSISISSSISSSSSGISSSSGGGGSSSSSISKQQQQHQQAAGSRQ